VRIITGLVVGLVCGLIGSMAQAAEAGPRTLSFEDRVNAQRTIERVYYGHQIGATKPFDQVVPRAVIEAKVRLYLEESAALELYWKTPITDEALQRELERMASGTRMPERLQEIYAVLGNDTSLIKECVARATLADRLTHNFYAFDPRYHAAARAAIDALREQVTSGALSPKADHPNRTVSTITMDSQGDAPSGPSLDRRVSQVRVRDGLHVSLPRPAGGVRMSAAGEAQARRARRRAIACARRSHARSAADAGEGA